MPNRVTELESKVAELEATVRGLTEEIVDANERLRMLEAAVDLDGDRDPNSQHNRDESGDETSTGDEVNTTKEPERPEETEESDAEQDRDEIIVA